MALRAKDLKVGDVREEVVIENLTRTQLVMYAGASGDYNPVHTDEVFATKIAGYPTVFAHGMLSMGWLGQFLVQAGGDGSVRKFRSRFAKITWPGDVITCRGVVTAVRDEGGRRIVDCDIWTETQSGERKVTGTATLALA